MTKDEMEHHELHKLATEGMSDIVKTAIDKGLCQDCLAVLMTGLALSYLNTRTGGPQDFANALQAAMDTACQIDDLNNRGKMH